MERLEIRKITEQWASGPRTITVVSCGCGNDVYCDSTWANACERCGTEYNGGGQMLAPRLHWGEETGETF